MNIKLKEHIIVHIPEEEMKKGEAYMLPIWVYWYDGPKIQYFDKKYYKDLGLTEDGLHVVALPVWLFHVNYMDESDMVHYKIRGRRWL